MHNWSRGFSITSHKTTAFPGLHLNIGKPLTALNPCLLWRHWTFLQQHRHPWDQLFSSKTLYGNKQNLFTNEKYYC